MTSAQDSWPDWMEAEVASLEAWKEEQLAEEQRLEDDVEPRDWTGDPQ